MTLRTLAARAGVSVAVVSAVINDSPHVRMSQATRDRVLREIERAGYVPNQAARSLRLRRSKTLAVVLPALQNPIFGPALEGIYGEAERQGYVIMLGEAQHLAAGSGLMERVVARGGADGLLVRATSSLRASTLRRILGSRTPVVSLEPHPDVRSVTVDDAAGVRLATRHLVEAGHRRVAFFGGDPDYRGTSTRAGAFRATLAAAGVPVGESDVRLAPQEPTRAYGPARELLRARPELTAVVCNNVTTAFGVAAAAYDLGIRVPTDLSLVAFHDVPDAAAFRPAITAVRMPMRELGERGVLALLAAVAGEAVEDTVVPEPPLLVERGSVAPPAR